MRGRYTSTAAFDELALRFGITVETGTNEDLTARYNVLPTQNVPIITASEKGRRFPAVTNRPVGNTQPRLQGPVCLQIVAGPAVVPCAKKYRGGAERS